MALNCGGNAFLSETGIFYDADREYTSENGYGYLGGTARDTWEPIGGADTDSAHYSTLRTNFQEYRFDVPPGWYLLRCRMLEHAKHGPGERIFRLYAEGALLADSIDIFAEVGRSFALDMQFAVQVTDGQLNVTGGSYVGAPLLTGIAVVSRDPDATPPSPPGNFLAQASFGEVNLDWTPPPDDDLAGFRVYRATSPTGPFVDIRKQLHLVSRHIDRGLDTLVTYHYYVTAVDVFGNESAPTETLSVTPLSPFTDSDLRVYELTVDPDDIRLMNQHFGENYYVPCTVTWAGETWTDALIRYKGSFVRSLAKKSYRLLFPSTHLFDGRRRVHLNAEMPDPSMIRNKLTLDCQRVAGVDAVTSRHFLAFLNDRFIGVYHDLEHYDRYYLLARPYLDADANIYKAEDGATLEYLPDTTLYDVYYDKTTNENENDWSDLVYLTQVIDLTPEEDFFEDLAAIVDVDEVVTYFAVHVIAQNINFFDHNYFLYHDRDRDIWRILPWDADFTWGATSQFSFNYPWTRPIDYGIQDNRLLQRIYDHTFLRRKFLDRMLWLLEADLADSVRDSLILANYLPIEDEGQRDWYKWSWEDNTAFLSTPAWLMEWSENREAYLRAQIPLLRTPPILVINEFMAANDSTLADEWGEYDDWVEIYNPTADPVSLQGWYLTDELSWGSKWAFPDTVIPPYGHLLVWADGSPQQGPLHANFQLSRFGEELGLFRFDPNLGLYPEDAFGFGEQQRDVSYARRTDGEVVWVFDPTPSPGEANGPVSEAPEPPAVGEAPRLSILGAHPFRRMGAFRLRLPEPARVQVTLHDVRGRRIRTLWDAPAQAGTRDLVWDGRDGAGRPVPSGVYWALLRSGGHQEALKVVLLRR
jgi:hypothetical protein